MRTHPAARRALRSAGYVAGGLRTAVPALFGTLLLPLALLPGILFLVFGMPLPAGLLEWSRTLTDAERRRAAAVLGAPIPQPFYGPDPRRSSSTREFLRPLRSRAMWRDLAWMPVHATVGFYVPMLVTVLWLSLPFAVSLPFWWWLIKPGTVSLITPLRSWPQTLLQVPAYLLLMTLLLVWLTPRIAAFEGWYARRLLGPTHEADLAARVEELTTTRAEALEAHGSELRRIERDLHDGTQAQLVTAALRLGLADRKFDADPDEARKLMLQARDGLEEALTELRGVIRGIYPPVLSDRGLGGAVRALAAGRPMPVSVRIWDGDHRCPAAVEAAAYFVVAEALTNVAKHSGADHAEVTLSHSPGHQGARLRIVVHDDGRGGADPTRGSGLAGIRRRVAALDGVMRIDSRADGHGTTLEVELPCAS